jgi:hypothetical protein
MGNHVQIIARKLNDYMGMDSFFMGSAQFVCCNLCPAIASEFNEGH